MILLIISLELEIFGVAIQKLHQNTKKWCLCEELLIGNDVEAVLVNFCCYDYGANASEAVQTIITRTLLELWLCRNREYPGNFKKKTVISKLFFQMSAQVKWEGLFEVDKMHRFIL